MSLLCIFHVSVYSSVLTHPASPHELLTPVSPTCKGFLLAVKLVLSSLIRSMLSSVSEAVKPSFSTHHLQTTHDFLDFSHIHPPNHLYQNCFSQLFLCTDYPCQFSLHFLHILVEMEILDSVQLLAYTQKGMWKPMWSDICTLQIYLCSRDEAVCTHISFWLRSQIHL